MELLDRITQSITARGRLLNQLATLTGRLQELAQRTARHAEACVYPQMKQSLEEAAAAASAQAKVLNGILSDNRVWAKLMERPAHEGINNWERVSGDLGVLGRLHVELNQHAVKWIAVDADIAERLRALVNEQVAVIDKLQEVTARSDPQAID
jgi:hypothetical protein